jgi:hypothetical protein
MGNFFGIFQQELSGLSNETSGSNDWAKEFMLFITMIVLIFIMIAMFHYSSIWSQVNRESRCVREKAKGTRDGNIYTVTAMNEYNDPLYKVSYDLKAKSYNLSCECPKGNVVNNFNDVKVFDLRNRTARTLPSYTCQCDKFVEPSTTYFDGNPGVVRFMESNDVSFFDPML